MSIILNERDKLNNGYHGFELLNKGMMTKAYIAQTPDGQKVFFKQFKSPSVKVEWYPGFKQYQQEIKARIEDSGAAKFCCMWHEQFEACWLRKDGTERPGKFFNQTYEFLEGGYDMGKELEKAEGGLEHMSFFDRVISARVMMNAIAALHKAGVVHTDLNPYNLMLVANDNPHVDAKYDVKLIDMDFALQVDKTAPWHGKAGYTGTPGWFSPEHKKNDIPLPASDVFTCGLILYELLGGKQPMNTVDEDDYLGVIEARSIPKPTLLGRMGDLDDPGNSLMVEEIIHQCLDPDPAKRPTAAEVNEALNNEEEEGATGGGPQPVVRGCTDPTAENYNPEAAEDDGSCTYPPSPPVGGIQGKLLLVDDASGGKVTFEVETKVGKALLRQFGDDHRFYHSEQYTLAKDSEGSWQVIPDEAAPNDTMYNGKKITETVRLEPGDQLAVGREEKGIIKLPLTVATEDDDSCTYPAPVKRPTAAQVNEALNHKTAGEDKSQIDTPPTQVSDIPEIPQTKAKGIVDLVFLVDTLQDMQPCIDALKDNFRGCIEALDGGALNQGLFKEWRAKVVGFQNLSPWLDTEPQVASPFTDSATVLENQLDSLEANGRLLDSSYGGEGPGCISLLESIYHCATMGQTEKDEPLSPDKWRPRNTGARVVVIFTGHEYYKTMEEPYKGSTLDDVINACDSNKIILQVFAPEMECYYSLAEIDKTDCHLFPYDEADPEGPVKALNEFISTGCLKESLVQCILGLRQGCAPEAYD